MPEYTTGDRRPIASRNLSIFQKLAAALARAGISANGISVAGMFFGILGGAALVATSHFSLDRWGFVAAAGLIQLRLLANMLDGMVAIAQNKASPVGELFNEIPDRISDTAILVGAGYALTGHPALGWAAACVALFVTYIRAVGKTMGVTGLFHGPMAKSHRMFLLTIACVAMAILPTSLIPAHFMAYTLGIIIAGGILTAFRRLALIVKGLK